MIYYDLKFLGPTQTKSGIAANNHRVCWAAGCIHAEHNCYKIIRKYVFISFIHRLSQYFPHSHSLSMTLYTDIKTSHPVSLTFQADYEGV